MRKHCLGTELVHTKGPGMHMRLGEITLPPHLLVSVSDARPWADMTRLGVCAIPVMVIPVMVIPVMRAIAQNAKVHHN